MADVRRVEAAAQHADGPWTPAGRRSGAHLSVTPGDVLQAGELAQRDRPADMQLLRGDAHLGAQAELRRRR